MADVPIDCDFPVWGLLPKKETGVVSFLTKNPEYDGRGTVIAIFDSGVDPAASGLKVTSTGETKVIERYDCSGCGDVDTSTVVASLTNGKLTGLTGRELAVPKTWNNPSGKWRLGLLYPYSLYPTKLKERIQEYRREHLWDVCHKPAFAKANKDLQDFESQHTSTTTLTAEEKLLKEELEARVDVLQAADKKFNDVGPAYDCILFHDGTVWRACIDNTENGDLTEALLLAEYSKTQEHSHLTAVDEMTVSINVHDDGDTLEVVGMCSSHGTHVAAISAGYFPDEPAKNGIAPGARIVSLTIGDSRLGSMETGAALVRACVKVMELRARPGVDVVNMSYGEHAHWSHSGRLGEIMAQVVNKYGASWVVSAGNHGPALCTVGAPPDIVRSVHIGVGAYVSPEMMVAAYSMRLKCAGGAFSWSSRGPAPDGAGGVSVCAPGGAVACVARFTLRNSQLMNGTSMAAPHVAGAVAVLISGLKAKNLPYTPYSIKRALENSATYLGHVEPWAQGAGLLNIEKAFEILSTYHDQPEREVTFNLQCGPNAAKGVLLRPQKDDPPKDVSVTVEPMFFEEHDKDKSEVIKKQIAFRMKLALACSAPWVTVATHLDMMNASRPLAIRFDTASLPPGPHFTSINAYDVNCVEKGPVFRIPVTVFQSEPLHRAPCYPSLVAENVTFRPSTIKRHFVDVPASATWAVLKMVSKSKTTGRFLVHTMQLVPHRSCRTHETQKMINVTSDAPTYLPFKLVSEVMLEIAIAKYWANPGDVCVDYSVEFRGVRADCGSAVVLHAAAPPRRLALRAARPEDVQPAVTLKHSESVLRPSDSKLSPLTARDVIPPARQLYQLVNTYNFHLAKATEVSPQVTLLCDMLYESEFEAQMWMLYNSCKQLMAVGDAYPSKYSVKLEKGDFVLRVCVRHEARPQLERLADMPVVLQQRLPQPIVLDVYGSQSQALTGGKKFNTATLVSGQILPIYIAPPPNDKLSRASITLGQTLTGSATFARDEFGRKVDTYDVQYVLCEPPKKPGKEKEKGKPHDDYVEALRELKTSWLGKLEGDKLDQVYEELAAAAGAPGAAAAHVAYLNGLDSPTDQAKLPQVDVAPDMPVAKCEQIISIADKVIKQVDQDKLLAYLGIKTDSRPDAAKIRQENEKQRGYLIDALCRRGTALARLLALSDDDAAREKLTAALKDNMAELLKFTDVTDAKAINYGIWHYYALKNWGRAIKLLTKLQEDKPSREVDERFVTFCGQLQWRHMAGAATEATATKFPLCYRPF